MNTYNQIFFELLRAGLWEKEARLSQFNKIDYAAIMQLAEEQSVVGLITAGLDKVVDVKVPQMEMLQFVGNTLQIEQQNKAMNDYVAWLIDYLRNNNLYAILVKGQGIAQCYKRPLWRTSGDVDLLLNDESYEKAKKLLLPLAQSVQQEFSSFKHQGMVMDGDFEVELHGTMHSRLSRRIDKTIDNVQKDIFNNGRVRTWTNGNTMVFLPAADNDAIFVFNHILSHFFIGGIGIKQICDLCRLLWTYRKEINVALLEKRIRKAGLMTEWQAFGAYAVKYLGMPVEAMPLYSADKKWSRKAGRINAFVLEVGNFGHNQKRAEGKKPYLLRKSLSSWRRLGDMLRHFMIFPKDSILFFGGVLRTGLHAAVRGE